MSSHAHLLPNGYKAQVAQWLQEDTPSFDYGGYVVGELDQKAVLYCKAEGVLAGVPFFDEVFKQLDCKVEWTAQEGEYLNPNGKIAIAMSMAKQDICYLANELL
ncbi:unnamed protein product [Umbelopsis ramanniana]